MEDYGDSLVLYSARTLLNCITQETKYTKATNANVIASALSSRFLSYVGICILLPCLDTFYLIRVGLHWKKKEFWLRPVKTDFMFNIQNLCQTDARATKLHKHNKIAQSFSNWEKIGKTKFCAIFSGKRAEMDARADVEHEISFNRPKVLLSTWCDTQTK